MPLTPKKTAIMAAQKKTIKMKKCPDCKRDFPLTKDYYSIDKSKSNGFKSRCKWCHRTHNKNYYDKVVKKKNIVKKQTEPMEWAELV